MQSPITFDIPFTSGHQPYIPNPAASCVYQLVPSYVNPPSQLRSDRALDEVLASNRKDPLPEWKLSDYDGNPLEWHKWIGQFRSVVNSLTTLPDDVKLTYLKTLVTVKINMAIADFAYSGRMYRDALRVLEQKFGQPQTFRKA